MGIRKFQLVVSVLTCCLTICQFSAAAAQDEGTIIIEGNSSRRVNGKKSTKRKVARPYSEQVIATAAVRADEQELDFATAERVDMGGLAVPNTWYTGDQSVIAPVPLNAMLLTETSLSGSIAKEVVTTGSTALGTLSRTGSSTSFGPTVGLAYGLSEHFYVAAKVSYTPGKKESQISGATQTDDNLSTSVTNNGWREPYVAVGATTRIGRRSRITAEFGGNIPVGNARVETNGISTVTNGLSGGGAISPSLSALTNFGSVKLIGRLSYSHLLERTTDTVSNGRVGSNIITGGDAFGVGAILEFPRAMNFGLGATYIHSEPSTINNYNTPGFAQGNSTTSFPATQRLEGITYLGIPLSGTNVVLAPVVSYSALLDRNINNVTIVQSDVWNFSFKGIVHF